MTSSPALSLINISKRFGPVAALRGVDFSLRPGEIHALLGENGAGKSTLLHVAFGMVSPDAGRIEVNGKGVVLRSPRDARAHRIGMVHQHFTSIGELTVRENIALAAGKLRGWDSKALGLDLDLDARVGDLSVALRQRLEIAKALATGAELLLLDEPSAVLAPAEVDDLLGRVRDFVKRGGVAALITHKLGEVFAAADRVTVLRQGAVTLHAEIQAVTRQGLADAMIGGVGGVGEVGGDGGVSDVSGVSGVRRVGGGPLVRIGPVSIYPGELIGVAAIEGQGHRELLRRIAGVHQGGPASRPVERVSVNGPVGFVPEDRSTEGLIPEMSLSENVALGNDRDPRWTAGGGGGGGRGRWIRWSAVRAHTGHLIQSFRIKAASVDAAASSLSGGNQQRLVLARVLESRPRVLVAENPTRGLDIRATAEIHDRLRQAARAGTAVLVYSSDLDEVLGLADRVLVVREGRVTEVPAGGGTDRRVVGGVMLGEREPGTGNREQNRNSVNGEQ